MFKSREKGLVAWALETNGEEELNEDSPIVAEVEGENTEIVEDASEIDDFDEKIEATADDAETLNQYAEQVEGSVENGEGISVESAKILAIGLDAIYRRLGFPQETSALPAFEAFGGVSSRVTATRIALETMNERTATIWKIIKDAIISLYTRISDFVYKILNGAERLDRWADSLAKKVSAIKEDKPKKGDLENKNLATSFGKGKGSATFNNAMEIIGTHVELAANMNTFGGAASSAIGEIESIIGSIKSAADQSKIVELMKVNEKIVAVFEKTMKASRLTDTSHSDHGSTEVYVLDGLIADKKIQLRVNHTGKAVQLNLSVIKAAGVSSETAQADTLKKSEMATLIGSVKKLTANMKASRSSAGDIKKLQGRFEKLIGVAIKGYEKSGDNSAGGQKDALMEGKPVITAMSQAVAGIYAKVPSLNYAAAKDALSYVASSLAQY